MTLLKGYQPHSAKTPGPKAAAAKAAAPKKMAVRPKASAHSGSFAMKSSVGSADSKRRKTTPMAMADHPLPHAGVGANLDDMCAPDKEIADGFQTRLQELRTVKPPLSEPQFKTYLGDLITKCNAFWSDVRTKKRSAQRRNNKDDMLPLVLDDIEEQVKSHINLLKCILSALFGVLSFLLPQKILNRSMPVSACKVLNFEYGIAYIVYIYIYLYYIIIYL